MVLINIIWILSLIAALLLIFIMFFESFSISEAFYDVWDIPVAGPFVLITSGVLTLMSIFGIKHILTTDVFWFVVLGVVGAAALTFLTIKAIKAYKRIKAKREYNKTYRRHRAKEQKYAEALGIIMPEGSICSENESLVDSLMNTYDNLKTQEGTKTIRRKLLDTRMLILHVTSMRGELGSAKLYNRIYGDIVSRGLKGDFSLMRDLAGQQSYEKTINEQLSEHTKKLEDNKMDSFMHRLNKANKMDTSGVLFSHNKSKVEEKTKLMLDAYNAAKFEYAELKEVATELNNYLKWIRAFAYRNIKLAIDVCAYGRPNASKNTLDTEKDFIYTDNEQVYSDISLSEVAVDSMTVISDTLNTFSGTLNSIVNDKHLSKVGAKGAVGISAGVAAIDAIGKLVKARSESISNNLETQKAIVKHFPVVVDTYVTMQGEMLRSIELMRSIIETSEGLYAVYSPLKDKVFGSSNQELNRLELFDLKKAIDAYKDISSSKI